jgi:hypothetical protein
MFEIIRRILEGLWQFGDSPTYTPDLCRGENMAAVLMTSVEGVPITFDH